mgnify:CR=1 FL=1
MRNQASRHILSIISAIVLLLIFSFIVSSVLPGENVFSGQQAAQGLKVDLASRRRMQEKAYRVMGYDLPVFYFSLSSFAVPDSFTRVPNLSMRQTLVMVAYKSAQPELTYNVVRYIDEKYNVQYPFLFPPANADTGSIVVREELGYLRNDSLVKSALVQLNTPDWKSKLLRFIPHLEVNINNQFHRWLFGAPDVEGAKGILRFDLGKSITSGMKISALIKYSLAFSLLLAVTVLLLSIPAGIFIGAWMAVKRHSRLVKILEGAFIFLYNMPSFLLAIGLVFLLANPDFLNWLPSTGPVIITNAGWSCWILSILSQWQFMILPVFVLSFSSVLYVAQLVYETLKDEWEKPYALTLRAMGYSERQLMFGQLLRNAILPVLVTMINLFPSLVSGSLLIDYFFSLNGLGSVLVKANNQHDLPVLAGVFFISGLLSVFTFYISDYFLRTIDPRVKLDYKFIGGENE